MSDKQRVRNDENAFNNYSSSIPKTENTNSDSKIIFVSHHLSLLTLQSFAAFRSIKQYPDCKIICEILEVMRFACRREEKIARLKTDSRFFMDKLTSASRNDINFIA